MPIVSYVLSAQYLLSAKNFGAVNKVPKKRWRVSARRPSNHFAYKIGLWKTFGHNNHAPVISVEIPGDLDLCFKLPVEQPSSSNDICAG